MRFKPEAPEPGAAAPSAPSRTRGPRLAERGAVDRVARAAEIVVFGGAGRMVQHDEMRAAAERERGGQRDSVPDHARHGGEWRRTISACEPAVRQRAARSARRTRRSCALPSWTRKASAAA